MQKVVFLFLLLAAQLVIAQQQQMSLKDAIIGRSSFLSPEKPGDIAWKNNREMTWQINDTLFAEDVKSGKRSVLMTLAGANDLLNLKGNERLKSLSGYLWTKNEELLLQHQQVYYAIQPGEKRIAWKIGIPEEAENAVLSDHRKVVAYTLGNDLYAAFPDGTQNRITADGGNGIVNGKSVHRNEFGISSGIFFSPGGNSIAFYRMDESMVSDYPLVDYMTRVAEHTPIKYPMAGMASHHVTVGVYSLETGKTIFLKTGKPYDRYFTNITWSPDEQLLYIAELNREQNHLQMNSYEAATGDKKAVLFEEKHDKYVEPLNPLLFSEVNENEFYYLSRRDGWNHVYKYAASGELKGQLTRGEWEVTRILGFSDKEKYMYVEATRESPLELHIYRVDTRNGKMEKLSRHEGIHRATINGEGSFLADQFSAPDVPSQTDLMAANGKFHKVLHRAANPLENYQLGANQLVPLLAADGKTTLTGRLILPVDFNPGKRYPVIVYVYGGPHSQLVDKSWLNSANWWQYYMAAQGFISFTMDNRGTSNRGREFETTIHRRLGVAETADQMKGIEYLKTLPYVDAGRIGVHGWSYGGFMTLNMMLRHPGVFKAGVAGGPVVDWSMYEIMYGERYMDMPQENPEGYSETNMLKRVDNLEGDLMLIHGVQDDVVVMQHSLQFLRECIKAGKQVDFFVYPTHPHNVRGKDRLHLMEKVSRYFMDKLKAEPVTREEAAR